MYDPASPDYDPPTLHEVLAASDDVADEIAAAVAR